MEMTEDCLRGVKILVENGANIEERDQVRVEGKLQSLFVHICTHSCCVQTGQSLLQMALREKDLLDNAPSEGRSAKSLKVL